MFASRVCRWRVLQRRLGSRSSAIEALPFDVSQISTRTLSTSPAVGISVQRTWQPSKDMYSKTIRDVGIKTVDNRSIARTDIARITNPAELSKRVQHLLAGGNFELAEELCRIAPKTLNPEVAWSEIIHYKMNRGNLDQAFGLYNDMKKRGLPPTEACITGMLRGLSKHTHLPTALTRATALYESLSNPNSPFQPNIKHTNAYLTVCMKAGSAEAMWPVLEGLPDHGPNAPDTTTYTIILHTLRGSIILPTVADKIKFRQEYKKKKAMQLDSREETIDVGLRLWSGILTRWQNGKLNVDEDLVLAMCSLLALSARKELQIQVLTLMEGFYGIPRLTIKKGTVPDQTLRMKSVMPEQLPEGFGRFPVTQKVMGIALESLRLAQSLYVKKYWKYFTDTLRIKPDLECYNSYMRVFATHRQHEKVLEILGEMCANPDFKGLIQAKTYYIAMSCVKSSGRKKAFQTAQKIFELYRINKPFNRHIMDPKLLHIFLAGSSDFSKRGESRLALQYFRDTLFPLEGDTENPLLAELPSIKARSNAYYREISENLVLLKIELYDTIKHILAKGKEKWATGEREKLKQYRIFALKTITQAMQRAEGLEVTEKVDYGFKNMRDTLDRKLPPDAGKEYLPAYAQDAQGRGGGRR